MPPPARPLRSDAVRNRESLLAAAEDEFAARGLDASVADIARRAGVAKGTVFRHFATKEELIAAVVARYVTELRDVARRLLDSPEPGAALLEFLTVAADQRHQRDLTIVMSASADDPNVLQLRDDLHAGVVALVDRARDSGAIRRDITGTDVFVLICAPVHAVEYLSAPPPDLWRRYLAIIFDGFRPEGASPLPQPAPSWP
ncbi:TetR/AcrR family transcriptional regulator [Mycolicibacterium tusciae]|uniref:TetR/AcrR family transcriptional regulator n=1 Tax=Mycolicibacterium tusciae TaxID=75922 RepID=UPI00024A46F2|nr:TetR/AcrR family transcriptional regulator [Mycolicibacterium tusciae]